MTDRPSLAVARLEDLDELLSFIDARCVLAGVPDDAAFAIRLAAEEAFVNIVRHGYGGKAGPVRLTFDHDERGITLTFLDEAPRFDPGSAPPPDLESPAEERREGGLGWHLIGQLMDEVHHQARAGRGNILTLVKHLGENG